MDGNPPGTGAVIHGDSQVVHAELEINVFNNL
jgi:hypothetical protein